MSYNTLPEGSIVLRLEFSIEDAVHQRGLLAVLATAVSAWWNRPRLPDNLPAHLRADLGLPPDSIGAHWLDVSPNPRFPDPLRRPGM
ncbi:hypothetical protein [Devosia sp. Root635]|uniref:hypothetical protein n=1 Tax=Devosia sp. Root635 TaxID=1736575 RepID=UPI0006FD9905|nr:hypothetical protein [Devosia sp. Root635]KRA41990.1 hypothetical protein ASD80_09675 [Devosia sp. Root635]